MPITKQVLDRQSEARVFPFGTTAAGGEALVTLNKGTLALTTVLLDVKASANIAGDLNLVGNLNITGAVNTQTVTNTNVTDLTITVNDGGTTPTDNTSGILVEGTGNTIAGALYFNNTSTTKFAFAVGGDAVGTTAVQTLTNKSISGTQITSVVANATLAASVTTNANLSGVITSVGNVTSIGVQTGTGSTFVVQTSPTLITPVIGAATGTSLVLSGNSASLSKTVGVASSVAGDIIWRNATNAFTQTFRGSNPGADIVYVLPTTAPTAGQFLSASAPSVGISTLTWTTPGGGGTVTSVSVTTNAGVSGVVATASSTPAITITLGAITPTSVAATGTVTGSNLSGTNTGDQTITLTGDVTGSGTGSFAATLAKYHRKATLTGTQDSTNKIFTIGTALRTGSDQLFINGALLNTGASNDYIYDGVTTFTFQAGFIAPSSTDTIIAYGLF